MQVQCILKFTRDSQRCTRLKGMQVQCILEVIPDSQRYTRLIQCILKFIRDSKRCTRLKDQIQCPSPAPEQSSGAVWKAAWRKTTQKYICIFPKKSIPRMRKLFPLRGKVPAGGNCKAERLCTEVLCKHNRRYVPFPLFVSSLREFFSPLL